MKLLFTSQDDRVRLGRDRTLAGDDYLVVTLKVGFSLYQCELALADALELAQAIAEYAAKRQRGR